MNFWIPLFFLLSATVLLIYAGYPAVLRLGLLGRRLSVERRPIEPTVTFIVPAHNEGRAIAQKITNLLALDYPPQKLEIIVGSDGSTDDTEASVRGFARAGIKLVASRKQLGKSGIQNLAVQEASGEILAFTDADCVLAPDALRSIVENFADPGVGLVTCGPCYSNGVENQISQNEGLYWRYENWLRGEESMRGLLSTASGWLFSMRRSLWKPLDPNVGDDFVLPLGVALAGRRNVVDTRVRVTSRLAQIESSSMFRMKMRIVSKDLRGLWINRSILSPLRTGPIAIGLWLHKLLRWLVTYFLMGIFLSTLFLGTYPFFLCILTLEIVFYAIAITCWLLGEKRTRSPWSIALSFCLVNAAAFMGTLHFATGKTIGIWRPIR